MNQGDTIAAIATAAGEGAVGIVRVSGSDAEAIGRRVTGRWLIDRRAVFCRFTDPASGEAVDEGLAILMRAPHSYSGEDVVELQGHGGLAVPARVLSAVLAAGARVAHPGEFTLRAFLNRRLDLTQAESVLALVQARTPDAARVALNGVAGGLRVHIAALRTKALELLAYLCARADFPDEDVPLRDVGPELKELCSGLTSLVQGADYGIVLKDGVSVALAGRPNAGKSSLLNRLLGEERAIVSPAPGTTRDTIAECANVLGIPMVFTDTAGIRESCDPVEQSGVDRARRAIAGSALVVIVVDASRPLDEPTEALLTGQRGANVIAVLNKSDLEPVIDRRDITPLLDVPAVACSAMTGEGIESLMTHLRDAALAGAGQTNDGAVLGTLRQQDAARRALTHVTAAAACYDDGLPEDLLSVDLSAAVRALGELTGDDATEDLLDMIFSRFCIGK